MKRAVVFALAACLCAASAAWGKVGGGDITFAVTGASDVVYSHEFHVSKNLKCTDCHYQIFNMREEVRKWTMADMAKGKSCGACHNGSKAFDVKGNCARCHP